MTLLTRYKNGETITVWNEIEKMGSEAFKPHIYPEVEQVLDETFKRVRHNLAVIEVELIKMNYQFNASNALNKPLNNIGTLLTKLDKMVKPFGYVPVSLKKFYQIVGSCNFSWDYENNDDFMWQYADPILIDSLDEVIYAMKDMDWREMMRDNITDGEPIYIELAPDVYHKDNVSGGMPYSIEITKPPSIDSLFLFEKHETTFVNYLRICFDNCGFSRITNPENGNDYEAFFKVVKPKLFPI
jgi:hypothetical protein